MIKLVYACPWHVPLMHSSCSCIRFKSLDSSSRVLKFQNLPCLKNILPTGCFVHFGNLNTSFWKLSSPVLSWAMFKHNDIDSNELHQKFMKHNKTNKLISNLLTCLYYPCHHHSLEYQLRWGVTLLLFPQFQLLKSQSWQFASQHLWCFHNKKLSLRTTNVLTKGSKLMTSWLHMGLDF